VTSSKVPTGSDAPLHSPGDEQAAAPSAPSATGAVNAWQDDLRLMTLVAAGNVDAMNTVARRLSSRVRRLSRGILRNEALADDAAQIALVEILQSAKTFGGRSSLERWADRITARISLRQARDERRRSSLVDSFDDPEAGAMPVSERELPDVRSETARPLDEYLLALPSEQREALVLKHSLGYTVEEIAELTDVPTGTVKDRLVTARRRIRRLIQRDITIGRAKGPLA
jgi:RNA polymerase sigma-70 factor (ECF subfamily)